MVRNCLWVLLLSLSPAMMAGAAEEYPLRPVRVVVGFPPGGSADIPARIVSQRLAERLKQPVVIENKPGANGGIGAAYVARSAPDGYTLLFSGLGAISISQALSSAQGFDSVRDFAPVSTAVDMPVFLVVPASSPAKNLQELLGMARANPGKLNFASVGIGSLSHLSGELLNMLANTKIVHVPYKGGAPALTATIAGEVPMMFNTGAEITPHVRSGKLRVLGIASLQRSPTAPDVPTLTESGVPKFEASSWFGFLAPAGTPRPIVERLSREIAAAVQEPAIRDRFLELSVTPMWNTPDQFADLIKSDIAKWTAVVKETGAKAN